MLSARCDSVLDDAGAAIWTEDAGRKADALLMASCTEIQADEEEDGWIRALDCIDGALIPRSLLPAEEANYTQVGLN